MSKISDSRKTSPPCFEKELDTMEEPQPDNVDNFDIEIEKMYIEKFKQQREKIETITKEFEQQKTVLDQKSEHIENLEKKICLLTEQAAFKKKYEDLYRDYKVLEYDNEKLRLEVDNLKNELSITQQEKVMANKQMRALFKDSSYKFNEQISQLRELLDQKQKIIEAIQHKGNEQAKKLNEQIYNERGRFEQETEQWNKKRQALEDQINQLKRTVSVRDNRIRDCEEEILAHKKTIESLNFEVEDKENSILGINQEYKQLYQKMKFHIRSLKKQLFAKEEEITENKENLLKLTEQVKRLERRNSDLSDNLKQTTKNYEEHVDRSNFEWQEEKKRYVEINNDFKATIEELLKTKGHLNLENERLLSLLRQKENVQKLRNEIKRNEFSEIDRVERIVRKI